MTVSVLKHKIQTHKLLKGRFLLLLLLLLLLYGWFVFLLVALVWFDFGWVDGCCVHNHDKICANFRGKLLFPATTEQQQWNGDKWKCTYPVGIVVCSMPRMFERMFNIVVYRHIKLAFLLTDYVFGLYLYKCYSPPTEKQAKNKTDFFTNKKICNLHRISFYEYYLSVPC